MGGGGVMKAAAKAATIGVVNGGFRTIPSENPIRSAARQIPTTFSSTGDDWEFAVDEQNPMGTMPRLVFGGKPPTIQEAKDATSELKDAIDRAYLSSPNVPRLGLSCITMPMNTKIIDRVTKDGTPSLPKNALQAFTILSGNPAAQAVVASIACDPHVWNAVMQNEALVEFLQSNTFEEKSESNTDFLFSFSTFNQSSDYTQVLKKSVKSITRKVFDMVADLSDYFNDLFAVPIEEEKTVTNAYEKDGNRIPPADVAKLMGLVVMVIAIIFLKRD